jgi:hypothetical protein
MCRSCTRSSFSIGPPGDPRHDGWRPASGRADGRAPEATRTATMPRGR